MYSYRNPRVLLYAIDLWKYFSNEDQCCGGCFFGILMDSSVVLPALVAGRVLFSAIPFCDILQYDHQLTSPLTSYSHCEYRQLFCMSIRCTYRHLCVVQEGIYLFRNGIDPYSGGVFRHVSSESTTTRARE